MVKRALLVAVVAGISVVSLRADEDSNMKARGVCREDVQKFCADVKPGQGRIWKCLKEHSTELSPACSEHLNEVSEKSRDFRGACRADVRKNCRGVRMGKGRIIQCLKEHESNLSDACKSFINK